MLQKHGPIDFGIKHRDGAAPATEGEIKMSIEDARKRREAPLDTPSNLGSNATNDISAALTVLLADVFALYIKTKNFHWHTYQARISGIITFFLTSRPRRFSR
jgi:hypothetical protein